MILTLCCLGLFSYSSTIFNALVWSTEFPFLSVKCHICHICHTLFLSPGHGHTLVFLQSTSFRIGPFLEYQFWVQSQLRVLTLVISCNHINPGVLDRYLMGFCDMTCPTSFFFLFFLPLCSSLVATFVLPCSSLSLFATSVPPCSSKKYHRENTMN